MYTRVVLLLTSLMALGFPPASQGATASLPEAVVKNLDTFLIREVADKKLPALSIALVDDQKTVWSKGYGIADPATKKSATADTVYRAGSLSKLLTAVLVMRLVEQGRLDLDAPVTKYLPEFRPKSRFARPVTLRMLLSHASGLPREAPVGHYFDITSPGLERTIRSLNQVELVHEPGTRTKYSNAGVAVAGRVLEEVAGQRFARLAHNHLLVPLGLKNSGFEPSVEQHRDLAKAILWAEHGREFDAPVFELGTAPAGGLSTTVADLARFVSFLFAENKGDGSLLKRETREEMYRVQAPDTGKKVGRGLGFDVRELDGQRTVGHGGNIHGYSSYLLTLPDERLGVVVMTSRDFCGGVARKIAETALRQMRAVRAGSPLPRIEETQPIGEAEARALAGRYGTANTGYELTERDGRLWVWPVAGGPRTELRRLGDELVTDDRRASGTRFRLRDNSLEQSGVRFPRENRGLPPPVPARWQGLLGEYGPESLSLIVLESGGRLHTCLSSAAITPLTEVSENTFAFPEGSLYEGEQLSFSRDKSGQGTSVTLGTVVLERRPIDGEGGRTFKIRPLRAIEELRRESLAAHPPAEPGEFRKSDLVDVTTLDGSILLDVRYATPDNFLGRPLYTSARAFMQRPAAESLVRAHKRLAREGYGLMIHDAYRPWFVTRMFWEATPVHQRTFVADPSKGSRHNRGCAVDLTLYERATGKAVVVASGYDEFSDRAYPHYPGGTSRQRWYRELLRQAMEREGFTVYEAEWWHFDYKDWKHYPIGNFRFEDIVGPK